MKFLLILLLLSLFTAVHAEQPEADFSVETTLLEVSRQNDIPAKKLRELLGLAIDTDLQANLAELDVSPQQLQAAMADYRENKIPYFRGFVIIGISIVFLSLMLVGLVISLLQHLCLEKKRKTVKTKAGIVSAPQAEITKNGIIAAITAFCLQQTESKEENNLKLTWNRPSQSQWRNSISENNRLLNCKRGR